MSSDAVQQIKDRLSIVDVVAPYVQLMPAGKNLKGKSPFTNERTPSFYVSPDRGMFYCFSSSKGGDIFTFVQEMEGVDFKGALKTLAERAGVALVAEDPKKRSERDLLYTVLDEATTFFEANATSDQATQEYLEKRGLNKETIVKWKIGYAPGPPVHGWRELFSYFKNEKGYQQDILFKAGLIKSSGEGKEPYDVFRDRVMFPLFDPSGRVVAFSGRLLTTDSDAPKYVNSPETELYNKSELLYGYHLAKQGIRALDFSLIVEGQFDVVLCHQVGYHNTVAVSGTALTSHHAALLHRLSPKVVLALDGDKAGIRAIKRAATLMIARGMDVKVATLPSGTDPADAVLADLKEFKKIVGASTHVISYFLNILKNEVKDGRAYMLLVREEVVPLLAAIPSTLDQEFFIGVIADSLQAPKDSVRAELRRYIERTDVLRADDRENRQTTPDTKAKSNSTAVSERKRALEVYVSILLSLVEEEYRKKADDFLTQSLSVSTNDVLNGISPEEKSQQLFTTEAQVLDMSKDLVLREVVDSIQRLADLIYLERQQQAKLLLSKAEQSQNDEEIMSCLTMVSKLHQEKSKAIQGAAELW